MPQRASIFRIAAAIIVIPAAIVAVLGQSAAWWWLGDLCCHWTLHAAIVLIVGSVVWRRHTAISRACVILLLVSLIPWVRHAFADRAPSTHLPRVSIDWANLYRYNEHRSEALEMLHSRYADLLGLTEVLPQDRATLSRDAHWPYQVWTPTDSIVACALLSKNRIVSHEIITLEGHEIITAIVDMGDTPLRVIVLHFAAPQTLAFYSKRNRQMSALVECANRQDLPTLVIGDFNTTAASALWHPMLTASGLLPAAGLTPATWPAWSSPWARCPGIAIDHILVRDGQLAPLDTFWIPGSDHLGLTSAWEPVEKNVRLMSSPPLNIQIKN